MKLPTIRRILREDIPEAPEWILPLLYSINNFFDTVYNGLNHNITINENLDQMWKSFQITAGAAATDNTYRFLHTLKNKPRGVSLEQATQVENVYTPLTAPVGISWRVESNQIVIESIAGLTSGKTYEITVLVK